MTTFCGFKLVPFTHFLFGYTNNLENYCWTEYFQVSFFLNIFYRHIYTIGLNTSFTLI
jgi:hypothetical protein